MTLFGLTQEDVTQVIVAFATLLNLLVLAYQKVNHARTVETKKETVEVRDQLEATQQQVTETHEQVKDLTNGKLKEAVKDAVNESLNNG